MESRGYGSVVLRRDELERSVLPRSKIKSVWEGCGAVFRDKWHLRTEINVFRFWLDEGQEEKGGEYLRLKAERELKISLSVRPLLLVQK